ncbi:MAG: hypothetical protein HC892_01650 [Saprospiraceae bacterium]|nr:hypothetical protein [Saprospiraceae bacterium]
MFVWFNDEYYSAWQIIKESVAVSNVSIDDDEEPEFVRIMKGLSFMRTVSLSPYLFKMANLGVPTAAEVVETSPKIKYVMECIKHIKDYQAKNNEPMKGIIIYCNLGTNKNSFGFSLIELLAEYLTDNKIGVGFRNDEVKLIYSKITEKQREVIKRDFNDGRVKVIIGSATIKEGIDLQKDTIGMFNLTVDWNPTDATQIEGRCHRQGNKNAYVFINYVLLADSADVVYFQKLQDKTSRIKEIWDRENIKSDMDLKEFDPNKIKADLMTRADKIAVIEQDRDISVVKRENDIIMAKVEEMNKANDTLEGYSNSKQPVIENLTQLELAIVEYRRAVRIEGRDAKIKELKEQFTEIEFNEDLTDEDKEKERKKIKSELSKVQGEGFVAETNEMFKVENDFSIFTDEQLADKLKKEQEKFRYGGTYYKYMETRHSKILSSAFNNVPDSDSLDVKTASENIARFYSFFNPEK